METWRGEPRKLLRHLNSIRSTIQFAIEKEERGQLPFLDVLVRKDTLSQQFHFSVFRKPTHTDSYINYKSNHHPATKIATILCLRKRAEDICQGEDLKKELNHIEDTFIANGYPRGLVKRTLHKRKGNRQPEEETDEQERILCLPYIKGISETLHRTCRPLKVRIVHKAPTTLRSLLTRVKPPTPKDQVTGVIYQIPCECGDNYIGETSKTLNERLKEHQRAVRRMDNNNSVAVHVRDTGHNISWENAKIMLKEDNKMRRKRQSRLRPSPVSIWTKESIWILSGMTLFN